MKNKKQILLFIIMFSLIIILGTISYAFYNYTRTGTNNLLTVGRINFNATEGEVVTLSNLYPIITSGNVSPTDPGVGSVTLNITGDTNYSAGIEYLVKAVDVSNTSGSSALPISINITYAANGTGKTIGTSDENYFTNRGGNTSIYKLLSTDTITDNQDLVVGYIAPGATGIDGNVTIIAYLDANNIAITDTTTSGGVSVSGYTNGTGNTWVDGRTVFTTEEWNALEENGVSFKIQVEANEGIWVLDPNIPEVTSCPGCKFYFDDPNSSATTYTVWNTASQNPTVMSNDVLYNDYRLLARDWDTNVFLGLVLNDSNQVTEAYACGIKDQAPNLNEVYCVKGLSSNGLVNTHLTFLRNAGYTCKWDSEYGTNWCGITSDPYSDPRFNITTNGLVTSYMGWTKNCSVSNTGVFICVLY